MKKVLSISQYELPVIVEQDGTGFLASCSSWSDCYAYGDTVDEALAEIIGVAGALIELYREEAIRIPLILKEEIKVKDRYKVNLPLVVAPAA